MALELLVRPFQLQEITPPTVVIGGTVLADPVTIMLEAEGGKTFDFSYSFSGETGSSKNEKEVKRKSEKVRIKNPEDEDQYVDVKRAKEITTVNEGDPSIRRKIKFRYPDSQSA
jgi:hypothetical protein